jgi:hypothetical protein
MSVRSSIYRTILDNRKARIGLSIIPGLGTAYAAYKLPEVITSWNIALAGGLSAFMGGVSYLALSNAAIGKPADPISARAQATVAGIFTGALTWSILSQMTPHIPVVSNFIDTHALLALPFAFALGVEAGHAYKDLVRRRDLNGAPQPSTPAGPVQTKEEREKEYREFLIERALNRQVTQAEESRFLSRNLLKRAGMAVILTGAYCAFDPNLQNNPQGIVDYIAKNSGTIAFVFALNGIVLSGMLERFFGKIGRIGQKSGMVGLALTTVALANGFDPKQFLQVFSETTQVLDSYTASLLKTPFLSAALGIGYLKAPNFMNRLVFETVSKIGKYGLKYAWDRSATIRELAHESVKKETFISLADNLGGIAKTGFVVGTGVALSADIWRVLKLRSRRAFPISAPKFSGASGIWRHSAYLRAWEK